MLPLISRRSFVQTTTLVGVGLLAGLRAAGAAAPSASVPTALQVLSQQLTTQWLAALLKLQLLDPAQADDYGGIRGPGDAAVPGRIGELMYPLLRMAHHTQQQQYVEVAERLYRWTERRVSQPDGSWLNEPQQGSWKGTTVFMSIAMAEAVKNHGVVLSPAFRTEIMARLVKAGHFICDTFTIEYGNINYPITASYGLALLGEVLGVERFRQRGRELAHEALRFISPTNHLLFGEGTPYYETSKKGCYPVDLGYNVEESLPALAQYGLLTHDEEVLAAVTKALQAHLEFMLPDGGWDNSWGTRSYKWTYWGSRTSDGCQPAYALLAGRDPRFYQAALRNAQLLQRCTTAEGLLAGGPHAAAHGVPTSIHHTFCHLKALTTVLDYGPTATEPTAKVALPREQAYGSRFFADIQTWLIAEGPFRATVTGYDREYKAYKNGHASGGALTMLWHAKAGPLLAASMTEYQRYEAGNMAPDTVPPVPCLTPRIELQLGPALYQNISDLSAAVAVREQGGICTATVTAKLVDKDQHDPPAGVVNCRLVYTFSAQKVTLDYTVEPGPYAQQVQIICPVVAKASEKLTRLSDRKFQVAKEGATLLIACSQPAQEQANLGARVFNFVPGLEAIPFVFNSPEVLLEIAVG
jgi:hypothetical protein